MLSKGALSSGAADPIPTQNLRVTRSTTKGGTLNTGHSTPQQATLEKKKARAKEIREEEKAARKTLIDEKIISEGTELTHQIITRALALTIQKHTHSAPQGLIKTLQAINTLLQEANNATNQLTQFWKPSHRNWGSASKNRYRRRCLS